MIPAIAVAAVLIITDIALLTLLTAQPRSRRRTGAAR